MISYPRLHWNFLPSKGKGKCLDVSGELEFEKPVCPKILFVYEMIERVFGHIDDSRSAIFSGNPENIDTLAIDRNLYTTCSCHHQIYITSAVSEGKFSFFARSYILTTLHPCPPKGPLMSTECFIS